MNFYIRHGLPKRVHVVRGDWHFPGYVIELAWQFEFCGTRQRRNDSLRNRKPDYG